MAALFDDEEAAGVVVGLLDVERSGESGGDGEEIESCGRGRSWRESADGDGIAATGADESD
jgi:hypothetical protein